MYGKYKNILWLDSWLHSINITFALSKYSTDSLQKRTSLFILELMPSFPSFCMEEYSGIANIFENNFQETKKKQDYFNVL